MDEKTFVLSLLKEIGANKAIAVQNKSPSLTGTELYKEKNYIPSFQAAKNYKNMLAREVGFVCKSSAGRLVKLLQKYDSDIYTQEPEELPAQWGFYWSKDPEDALPYISISTSPYMIGDCAKEGDFIYKSKIDNNVWAPSQYEQGWELIEQE